MRFGTIQDVSVEFNQKLVELRGQDKFPDDVAPSDMDVKGKGAFGRIDIGIYNSLYFADTITDGINIVVDREPHTIPSSDPFTVVVDHVSDVFEDLGVLYAANLVPFIKDDPGPPVLVGHYSVEPSTGTYTFFTDDEQKDVLISYLYSDATIGRTLPVLNHIQGYGPVFELLLGQFYQGHSALRLLMCRSSKMSAPMKRDGYLISDFEFTAYANPAGKVFEWYQGVN